MKFFIPFVAAIILCVTCKKPAIDKPAKVVKSLLLNSAEAAPYQFIKIQLPTDSKPGSPTPKVVEVTIGNIVVLAYIDKKALASDTFAYYLLVPELPVGTYKIKLQISEVEEAEQSIEITAFNKISDVPSYIKNWQENSEKEINEEVKISNAKVLAGHLRRSTADSLITFIQEAYNKHKLLVDALPDSAKKIYAQLLDRNKDQLTEFQQVFTQNPLSNYRTNTEGDCEELRNSEVYRRANGFEERANDYKLKAEQCEGARQAARLKANQIQIETLKVAHDAAIAEFEITNGKINAIMAYVSEFARALATGLWQSTIGAESFDKGVGVKDIDETKQGQRVAAQEFVVDKEYNYSVGLQLVNVNRQDASLIPGFTEMIKSIDAINLNKKDFTTFLSSIPDLKVPAQKSEKLFVSNYTIDQISDSRIVIQVKEGGKGNTIKISFDGATFSGEFPFTFRVNYTSRFGTTSKIVEANLKLPVYKLGFLDGTPVPNSEISFDKAAKKLFLLLNEDDKPASGIDYNLISVSKNTNKNIGIKIAPSSEAKGSFALNFTNNQPVKQQTIFDIDYRSKKVQTVNATIGVDTLAFLKSKSWVLANSPKSSVTRCCGPYGEVTSANLDFSGESETVVERVIECITTVSPFCSIPERVTLHTRKWTELRLSNSVIMVGYPAGTTFATGIILRPGRIISLSENELIIQSPEYINNFIFNGQ